MLVVRVNRILHTRRKDLPPETSLPSTSVDTLMIRQREPSDVSISIRLCDQPSGRTVARSANAHHRVIITTRRTGYNVQYPPCPTHYYHGYKMVIPGHGPVTACAIPSAP